MKKVLSFALFVFLVSAPIIVQGADFTYNPNLVRVAQTPIVSQGQVTINWDHYGDFTYEGELALVNEDGNYHRYEVDYYTDCEYDTTPRNTMASVIEGKTVYAQVFEAQCAPHNDYQFLRSSAHTWEGALEECVNYRWGTCTALWRNNSNQFFMMTLGNAFDRLAQIQNERNQFIQSGKSVAESNAETYDDLIRNFR